MPNLETTSPDGNVNKNFNLSKGIPYVIKCAVGFVCNKLPPQTDNKIGSTVELPVPVLGTYVIYLLVLSQLMHWITHFQYSAPKIDQT